MIKNEENMKMAMVEAERFIKACQILLDGPPDYYGVERLCVVEANIASRHLTRALTDYMPVVIL